MSSLELKQCPSCQSIGNWRRSRLQGFVEKKILANLGFSPFRCETCGHRVIIVGDVRTVPSHRHNGNPRDTVPSHSAPSASAPPQEDEDFLQLITELKRSEKELEGDESR